MGQKIQPKTDTQNHLQNHIQIDRKSPPKSQENGFQRGTNQRNKQGTKNERFMISTNAFAPREIFKNPRVFNDFHGFRHSKMFEISVSKIIEKPFKILPESIKNRSRNWFEKHIQKTWEKMLPTAFKMAPKSFKIEARRAQNHPATPLGLARLPQTTPDPPQTSIWTDFGFDSNEFRTQNGRPETEKTKQSEVFSSSFRLRWEKIVMRLQFGCGGAAALVSVRFTVAVVSTLSRKEGASAPSLYI